MKTLDGKVALVTGGSRSIGAAIAERLASEGASVAITYASSAPAAEGVVGRIAGSGGRAIAIRADSADAGAVQGAVRETVERLGGLDILVNNAGVAELAPIDEFSDAQFARSMAINVHAVFYACREAAKHMGRGGRIIQIGSVNSDSMPFPGGAVYAMTKGAVASFTRGLARDLGPRGITVNTVQPGPIDTDMNPADGPFAETLKKLLALGHYGRAEDVAGLVAFLAGPEGAYITGAGLKIDGGFDA
ncbi:MAG: 3-oxoacyl-ACP reductase FabG [Phycisphaerales bacterium]|nr:3-oxoacyl-ACP reductase FabG [Phycisphaerales bacterium]